MFKMRRAAHGDVDAAVAALVEAFAADPLMSFLFHDNPDGVRPSISRFFSLLLRVRIALAMPADVLEDGHDTLGAVMGYDTSRPAWPEALAEEWRQFEAGAADLAARLAAYEEICEAHQPAEDHYYLGVIGVHPSLQGAGAGRMMLDGFCDLSRADPRSRGVYLDTTNPRSLEFYYRNGFELRGEGRLGDAPLWCVYRPT